MPTLDDAIQAIRSGDSAEGRRILEEILEEDENNEEVWLWLSSVVDDDEDREICLENVLALNPDNIVAQRGLEALRTGTFNVHTIVSEALGGEEEMAEPTTFLDEFILTDEEEPVGEEELKFPSTMKPAKSKKAKARRKGCLNLRVILLAIFVLVLVLALGGVAAYNMFLSGNGEQPPQSQETPAQGGAEEPTLAPTLTDTPTPIPTDTPTPTKTPFQLPTPKPTDLPTPTATPVVPPTPVP